MSQVSLTNTTRKIKEIVDFALQYSGYYNGVEREALEKYTELHLLYGTMLWVPGIAMARWNILKSRDVIHVIDLIIHTEHRNLNTLRQIAVLIWKLNPTVKSFYYDRLKYGESRSYGYSVKHWFKLKETHRHGRQVI